MITAIAGLETGTVEPDTLIDDKGRYTYYPAPSPSAGITVSTGGPTACKMSPTPL